MSRITDANNRVIQIHAEDVYQRVLSERNALTADNARLLEALELTVFAVNEGMAGENTDAGPTYQGMRRALQNIRASIAPKEGGK